MYVSTAEIKNPKNHWEGQNAYMSFERKLDATRFWMAVGIQNSGENNDNY